MALPSLDTRRHSVKYVRMPIEVESPEEFGYDRIRFNLSESSVRDRTLSEVGIHLSDLLLLYGEHRGHGGLIEAIAEAGGGPAGDITPDHVLVTFGAAEALFIIATTLLEKGDQVIVVRPNYATNIFTPRAIEADIRYLDLTFEDKWAVDVDRLAALMTPQTRYVSITVPHNPTGQVMSEADLRRIVEMVERAGCRLLVDETYREMTFDGFLPSAATLSPRAISVSSLSKTYGIPGIRTGWLICRDRGLMQTFLGAKEQIGICGSVVDEEIAYQALSRRHVWLPLVRSRIAHAFAVTRDWMAGEGLLEWVEPKGGVVCFPRVKPDVPLDVDAFYRVLTEDFATYVGPGHWFEQSRRHFRLGFGWPTLEELTGGLQGISAALRTALERE
jgi:aspartate/methionine/tyrosine aminotransferase